jgi:hypothetical protein
MKADTAEAEIQDPLAKRAAKLDAVLLAFRTDLARDRFAPATGRFREAVNLSRAWPELRTRVLRTAAEESRNLLPRNWRVADALLSETQGLEGDFAIPTEFWDKVKAARHDELISSLLYAVDRTELHGTLEKTLDHINRLLASHPDEPRILERLREIEQKMKAGSTEPQAAVETAAAAVTTPRDKPLEVAVAVHTTSPWRLRIRISDATLDKLKSVLTLAGATAMIAAAATMVWLHYAHPEPVRRVQIQAKTRPAILKASSAPSPAPDEKAWELVRLSQKPDDMRAFLKAFPASPHAERARVKLNALMWEVVDKSDTDALRAYLAGNPSSQYAEQARTLIAKAEALKDGPPPDARSK